MVAPITNIYDELQAEQLRKIDSFIEFLKKSSSTLRKMDTLTVLHQAQRICGSVPKKVQFYISERLDVSMTEIEALISFYEYFTKENSASKYFAAS